MHVVAFAPSTRAVVQDAGGVRLDGFPMTSAYVDVFPKQITVPLVLAVYTQGGSDYDPRRYIVARSPDGERLSVLECTWHWPDKPGVPVKFWVLTRYLPLVVQLCRRIQRRLIRQPRRDRNRPSIPSAGAQGQPANASTTALDSHVIVIGHGCAVAQAVRVPPAQRVSTPAQTINAPPTVTAKPWKSSAPPRISRTAQQTPMANGTRRRLRRPWSAVAVNKLIAAWTGCSATPSSRAWPDATWPSW